MYSLKPVFGAKTILEFENMRRKSFDFYIHRGFEMVNDGPMLVKKYPY